MKKFNAGNESLFSKSMEQPYSADPNVVQYLRLDEVEPCKYQARTLFNDDSIKELAESIKKEGLLQPITVRRIEPGRYEIISGERRYRAHKLLNESHVRAVELDKSDKQAATLSLIENIQRENLSPIEEAIGYRKLMESFSLPISKVAETTGKSRSHINNLLRVLALPEAIKIGVHQGEITLGHAKVLLSAPEQVRAGLYNEIVNKDLTVRQLEDVIKNSKEEVVTSINTLRSRATDNESLDVLSEIFYKMFNIKLKASEKSTGAVKCTFSLSRNDLEVLMEKLLVLEADSANK